MCAQQIIAWVRATSYIKNVGDFKKATEAFAELLCPDEDVAGLMGASDIICRTSLLRARVRVDLVAMLLFREAFEVMDSPSVYLWTDASPQWRGLEYCATTFDVSSGNQITRRLMPCLSLSRGGTTAMHKCLGLLWQCFLMVGPTNLQMFCRSVRSLTTDMGTERLISRMPIAVLQIFPSAGQQCVRRFGLALDLSRSFADSRVEAYLGPPYTERSLVVAVVSIVFEAFESDCEGVARRHGPYRQKLGR